MSRRAIKRYEQQRVLESSNSNQNPSQNPSSSDDEHQLPSVEAPSPVKTQQSLFALLTADDTDSDEQDDDQAIAATPEHDSSTTPIPSEHPSEQTSQKTSEQPSEQPATTKKKKRKKHRGKKRKEQSTNQQTDPDWIALNEHEAQTESERRKNQLTGYIPASCFTPEDDDNLRVEARHIMALIETMVLETPVDLLANMSITPTALTVEPRLLNADVELKRLFGARVVESERRTEDAHASRGRGRQARAYARRKISLVTPRETWHPNAPGLIMRLDDDATRASPNGVKFFRYAHEASYTRIQDEYRALVNMHDPNYLVEFAGRYPFHVDAMLQLAELYRQMGELERAGEWIERCLYVLEGSWNLSFKPFDGSCRLRFDVLENRSLYIALFRYSQLLTRRGLHRTALEVSKLLLNFDPETDPMGMLMLADSYALLSGEYAWIQHMRSNYKHIPIKYFPNFFASAAVASECLRLGMSGISNRGASSKTRKNGKNEAGDSGRGDGASPPENGGNAEDILIDAILTFPMIVQPLLSAIQDSSNLWAEFRLFEEPWYSAGYNDGGVLLRMARVYAERSKLLWNSSHNKQLLMRCARRAGELDSAAGMGKDGVTGLLTSAFVSDAVLHERVARCRALRIEAAQWLVQSGLYQHVQIADFADSTANLPAEILAGEGADQPVGAQRQREVSVTRGAMEFLQSLLPWREARDAREDEPSDA